MGEGTFWEGMTPQDIFEQAHEELTPELIRRLQLASQLSLKFHDEGLSAACVASSIAYTHPSLVEKFDFTENISPKSLAEIVEKLARLSEERLETTDFHDQKRLDEEGLRKATIGISSALISVASSARAHVYGILPAVDKRRLIVWDAEGQIPVGIPRNTETLLNDIGRNFERSLFYVGAIYSFRQK